MDIQKSFYTQEQFDVSVIIVNWNAGKYLQETIDSLYKYNSNISYEVILVDNASNTDEESYLYLNELIKYNNVTIVRSEINLGFAKANNVGMNLAKGRNFFILNPDVLFEDNCLKICITALDQHNDVGMVGPNVLAPDRTFRQECMRGKPYPKDTLFHIVGLAKKFPNNEYFNGYTLLHLALNVFLEC